MHIAMQLYQGVHCLDTSDSCVPSFDKIRPVQMCSWLADDDVPGPRDLYQIISPYGAEALDFFLDDLDEEILTQRLKLFKETGSWVQSNRQLLSEYGATDASSVVWLNKVCCEEPLALQGDLNIASQGCHATAPVSRF